MGSPIAGRVTRPRRQGPPREVVLECGPFVGMRDSLDPTASDPRVAALLQNCYPQDAAIGGGVVGRPGFQQMGATLTGAGRVQWLGQYTQLSGTETTVAIAGGRIFTFDWTSRVWSEPVTTANLTTAGVTLSTTARVYALTFGNKLVISDGTNTPFMWDGTSGAGGLTTLTNCPVLYGPPTVYYGKLVGIKNGDRATIVWSEEADATIGYETAPYTNRWTLGQADTAPLTALVGTNEALYVFRSRSTTLITGAVTSDFSTTGTRSGIDENIGTDSPWAIAVAGRFIHFLDADLRPHVLTMGGGVEPAWTDLRETVRTLPKASVTKASAVYDHTTQLVRFSVVELSQTEASLTLAMSRDGRAQGLFRGYTPVSVGMVKNGSGEPVFVHGSADGKVYDHGAPNGTLWSDHGTAIQQVVTTPYLATDPAAECHFTRVDAMARCATNMTNVGVAVETPYGIARTLVTNLSGSLSFWDVGVWDTAVWSADSLDKHFDVGTNDTGRWCRVTIAHEYTTEQFGLARLRVTGHRMTDTPQAA